MQNCVIPLLHNSVLRWVSKFCSISFKKIRKSRSKFLRNSQYTFENFDLSCKILFYSQKYTLLCDVKFLERKVENFVENTSKSAKMLNENERISFVQFREFGSTKISMEILFALFCLTNSHLRCKL